MVSCEDRQITRAGLVLCFV